MQAKHIDQLNVGLLFLSLILAFYIPYELFLVAYAILGPLHYLTEINWLKEKDYFIEGKRWFLLIFLLVLLIVVPRFFYEPWLKPLMETDWLKAGVDKTLYWTNAFIFLGIWLAVGWRYVKKWPARLAVLLAGIGLAYWLNDFSLYTMLIGFLLPTVIHVYIFTILFMLYGALKSQSRWGYASVLIAALIPFLIIFYDPNQQAYALSQQTKDTFLASDFHVLNTYLRQFLGMSDGTTFFFFEKAELKIQIFLAFAYTYHYLNWFSKTSIIGWHKKFTKKQTLLTAVAWLGMVALYAYDYKLGFVTVLLFSFLHVLLEFPLNVLTVRETFRHLRIN